MTNKPERDQENRAMESEAMEFQSVKNRHPIIMAAVLYIAVSNSAFAASSDIGMGGSDRLNSPNIGVMISVPAGSFQRDTSAQNISKVAAFWIGQYEITREQFAKVTGLPDPSSPRNSSGAADNPAQNITWYDAIAFSNRLSILEGLIPVYAISGSTNPSDWGTIPSSGEKDWDAVSVNWNANGYRLPTEMEWLWAAMGADKEAPGQVNRHGFRQVFAGQREGASINDYAWCDANAGGVTQRIGTKLSNELGIFDMTGNVWEWNWDWHGNLPVGLLADYKGAPNGRDRVLHGGSWLNNSDRCNIQFRLGHYPSFRYSNIGFRLVRSQK